jgi:Protein of unknown function (DUF1236)
MKIRILTAAAVLAATLPAAAFAQGAATGATAGAIGGAVVGGPVGAVVGAATGAIVGGISDASRPKFHEYVVREHIPSYTYTGPVVVGTMLPETVTVYDVPREYGVTKYRYAYVNNQAVLVDPGSHRIVEIIG